MTLFHDHDHGCDHDHDEKCDWELTRPLHANSIGIDLPIDQIIIAGSTGVRYGAYQHLIETERRNHHARRVNILRR